MKKYIFFLPLLECYCAIAGDINLYLSSAGSDYTDRGTLQFTFSQFVTEFDIPYEIRNDNIHENTEYFNSILSTSDAGAVLNPNSTRIRILDNDRKPL